MGRDEIPVGDIDLTHLLGYNDSVEGCEVTSQF